MSGSAGSGSGRPGRSWGAGVPLTACRKSAASSASSSWRQHEMHRGLERTWPVLGAGEPSRRESLEESSWDPNRCLRTSEEFAVVRAFSGSLSESRTPSDDSPPEELLMLLSIRRTDMPLASPLCIMDLPVLLDPSRASHRGVDCCDNCPRFPRRDDGAPPTERTNRSTTSKTAAMMPLSVAHGWKVACNGEAWLGAARSRVGVSLRVALSWTRRALAMSLPNCFSVGGSTSMISARLLRVDSISATAFGLSTEPSMSSKMSSASVHEKPRPAISSTTMGTPARWAHHSSSKQYGRRSTSLVARSTRVSLHSRPCVKSWCRLERSCESRKHGLCSTFCKRSRRYRASMPASFL